MIDSGPSDPSSSGDAVFMFSATEPGSSFECSLDAAVVSSCSSPVTYTGLGDGSHSFAVQATDPAGNTDPSPASFSWTINASKPGSLLASAEADSYVVSNRGTRNYGSENTTRVDGPRNEKHPYIRFDVSGISGTVTSATLRLFVMNGTNDGPRVSTAGNGWVEDQVTWNNRPSATSGSIDDVGAIYADAWVEYDVTSAVLGDGKYTFLLLPDSKNSGYFQSKEGGTNGPQLMIEFS